MRFKCRKYLWILCAALALTVLPRPRPLRAEESVDSIVKRGLDLRRAGKDSEGLAEFQRALQLQKSARIQAQVALAEQAVGLWVAAETDLIASLASGDDPWIKKNRAALTQALTVIQGHLGSLEVWGSPKGAQILVDGKPVGKLPLASPVRVLSGDTVILGARAPGYSETNRTVRIAVGSTVREHVELVSLAPPPATIAVDSAATRPSPVDSASSANASATANTNAAANTTANAGANTDVPAADESPASKDTEPRTDTRRGLRPYAWGVAAGATVGVVFGVVETVTALVKKNEFENHTGPSPTDPTMLVQDCGTTKLSPACKPINDAHDKAVTLAIVGYAVGGALAVGSVVLFMLSSNGDHAPESAVACLPDPFGTGIACRFRF